MTTSSKNTIAIDFGTTNTYVAVCPNNAKIPKQLELGNNNTVGIETVLLYTDDPTVISPLIADDAVNAWVTTSIEDRQRFNFRFHSHFKPDIEKSNEARQNTEDFLKALLRDAQSAKNKLFPLENRVIIGVPSDASPSFRHTLKTIAENAGYGKVELVDEPIGAMLDTVADNAYPLSEIFEGLLVIDFGGGTCDFAFLQDGQVKHSWGDQSLGGRLFDDLFYRWFCDLNPGKEEELENNGNAVIARTFTFRIVKEKFSRYVVKNKNKPFVSSLDGMYGTVTGLTWEEFIRRAKNYTPTKSFINHQEEIGSPLSQKLKSGKTDLLQWFRDSIESGLREKHIDIRDIHVITLAGGSSQWAFVGEYCQDILKNDQFFKSVMPYAAIANGIAVLPVLEQEFKQKREELIRELPGVFKYLRNKVEESLNKNNTQIISKILEELFDKRILLHLCAFRQEGGKLCDLEQTVISEIEKFKPFANQIIQNETAGNLQPLFGMAVAHIREWLLKHNLRLNKNYRNTSSGSQQVDLPVLDVGESIGNIAAIAGGLTAMIVASTGLGLLSIPAVGWIGVIVLAVVTFFGGLYTAEAVRRISLPTTVTKLVLTDKQINKCREQAEEQLQLELNKTVKLASDTLMGDIEKLVNAEISRLNFTNIIR